VPVYQQSAFVTKFVSGPAGNFGESIKIPSTINSNSKACTTENMLSCGVEKPEPGNFNPFQGQTKPEPVTADDINEGINQLDIQSPFVDYGTKGHAVELLEKEDIEGTECYKIRFT
jgi:hypothetical protein